MAKNAFFSVNIIDIHLNCYVFGVILKAKDFDRLFYVIIRVVCNNSAWK